MLRTLAAVASLLLLPGLAMAGLVGPGQSIKLSSPDLLPPAGTKLEQQDLPFTLDYGIPSPSIGFSGSIAGTLHSSVYSDGGMLTFVYDIDLAQTSVSGAAERSEFSVRSFEGFKTDVTGALDFEQFIIGSRSSDGKQIRLSGNTPGLGGAPTLIIKTDATAYDAKGKAVFSASDEIPLLGGTTLIGNADATIDGVLRPVTEAIPQPPPPAAIPLPPAASSGIAALIALAIIASSRRIWVSVSR